LINRSFISIRPLGSGLQWKYGQYSKSTKNNLQFKTSNYVRLTAPWAIKRAK